MICMGLSSVEMGLDYTDVFDDFVLNMASDQILSSSVYTEPQIGSDLHEVGQVVAKLEWQGFSLRPA